MSITRPRTVLPTTEARAKLSQIVAAFERDGVDAEPVTFGSHRNPQGVIIGWDLWLEILPAIENRLDAAETQRRLDRDTGTRLSFDDAAQALDRDPADYR